MTRTVDLTARTRARQAAASVVASVAVKLADVATVTAVASASTNLLDARPYPRPVWQPDTLGDGHPGVGLLFAELAAVDSRHRTAGHHHLSAARDVLRGGRPRLLTGVASVAFAAQAAATTHGDYRAMLEHLDRYVVGRVIRHAREDLATVRAGAPIGVDERYDLVSGTAGLGRYLLARQDASELVNAALKEVLECLVAIALAPGLPLEGERVPAWWSGVKEKACVNLGLAHGVAGPLALLAISFRAGQRVEGQHEAMERIVELFWRWCLRDEMGPYWPLWVTLEDHRIRSRPARGRDAWCYGAAGIGRALYLAGMAMNRSDWRADAEEALNGAIANATARVIHDPGLCHGWSGVLQIFLRMAADTGDPRYAAAADIVVERVLAAYRPESPFGFPFVQSVELRPADRPGFIDGAAGVALALHTYATATTPRTTWDAALLLA